MTLRAARSVFVAAAMTACAPMPTPPANGGGQGVETDWIDGRCDDLFFHGVGDLSGTCVGRMRLDERPDGGMTVTFTADGASVAFSGSGRTATMPGGPDYLVVEQAVLTRPAEASIVRRGTGSCGLSGGPGPTKVRCAIIGGATAEFTAAGTPPRRSVD